MKLHHTRHHQGYVNGLNAAEKAYAETTSTREKIALQSALRFNGGGVFSRAASLSRLLMKYVLFSACFLGDVYEQDISTTRCFGPICRLSARMGGRLRTDL